MLRCSLIAIPKQIIVHFYFVAMQFCKLLTLIRFALHLCDHLKMRMSAISPLFSTGEHLKLSNSRKYCFIATSTMAKLTYFTCEKQLNVLWFFERNVFHLNNLCAKWNGNYWLQNISVKGGPNEMYSVHQGDKAKAVRNSMHSTQNVLMFWLFFW